MPIPLSRLQIAQLLHPMLQREIGHAIEIERLLGDPRYARDVLLVCDALPDSALRALAAAFRASLPVVGAAAAMPVQVQRPTHRGLSRDSVGLGLSQPAAAPAQSEPAHRATGRDPPATGPRKSWLARLTRR